MFNVVHVILADFDDKIDTSKTTSSPMKPSVFTGWEVMTFRFILAFFVCKVIITALFGIDPNDTQTNNNGSFNFFVAKFS